MAATEPIRNKEQLRQLAEYFLSRKQYRNHAMLVVGTYTALRISDLLRLTWPEVYDPVREKFRSHINVTEHSSNIHLTEKEYRCLARGQWYSFYSSEGCSARLMIRFPFPCAYCIV